MGTSLNRSAKFSDSLKKFYDSRYFFTVLPLTVFTLWLALDYFTGRCYSGNIYYVSQYLFTYDHGFLSRGLIGEILSWFFDVITPRIIINTSAVLSLLLIVTSSFTIGFVMNRAREDERVFKKVLLLILLLCVLPNTLRFFFMETKLEKPIWALTLLAALCTENKKTIWLTPLLCVLCVVISPVFMVGSMPLISIILLQKFLDNGYSPKNAVLCVIAYGAMLAMAVYVTLADQRLGFATPDEMIDFYYSRFYKALDETDYDIIGNYGVITSFNNIFDFGKSVKDAYALMAQKEHGLNSVVCAITFVIPSWAAIGLFWKKASKNETNKFQKFIFFVCACVPVFAVIISLVSWELARYFAAAIPVQLCLVIYYLVHDNEAVKKTADSVFAFFRSRPAAFLPAAVYFIYLIRVIL